MAFLRHPLQQGLLEVQQRYVVGVERERLPEMSGQ
jgi:hypothetical protein